MNNNFTPEIMIAISIWIDRREKMTIKKYEL